MTTTGSTGTTGTTAKEKVVPLISSDTAGPLGALHLPRLWAKLMLAAHNRLPSGYDECGTGFDQMTINNLNLDKLKLIDFVRTNRPKYMELEQWVIDQNGGKISPETIQKHNDAIRSYEHADDLAAEMRKSAGISNADLKDAVTLNKVEDLDELHRQVTQS